MSDTVTSTEPVLYEVVDQHIAVLRLNRPKERNAVNGALAQALQAACQRAEADEQVRVGVLLSATPGVFCAGADLAEIAAGRGRELFTKEGGFAGFADLPRRKPWIAAIDGPALAGGCELALACDLLVASERSSFGLPEVSRGIIAAAGGAYRLPRVLPRQLANEMLLTGQPQPAERLHALGWINRLVPDAEVLDAALALARSVAGSAPLAVAETLAVAKQSPDLTDAELRQLSMQAVGRVLRSDDAKEGPRAFFERRAPRWTGR